MAREELITDEQVDEFLRKNYGYDPKPEDFMLDVMTAMPAILGFPLSMMRYRGVKRKQASDVAGEMLPVKGTYHEPFVGSGSSLYRIGKAGKFEKAIASDLNPEIMGYLKALKEDPKGVAQSFKAIVAGMKNPTKGLTLKSDIPYLKSIWDEVKAGGLKATDKAAADLVLGNYTRMYMPGEAPRWSSGRYKHPGTVAKQIEEFGEVLAKTVLKERGWEESFEDIKADDFINLDTPYLGTKTYPGIKPTTAVDHRAMSNILRETADKTSGIVYNSPIGGVLFDWMEMEPTGYLRGEEVMGKWGKGWKK